MTSYYFKVTSWECHSVKILNPTVGYSIVAMQQIFGVISLIIWKEQGIQCMPCSSQIISEIIPEIHTMEKRFSKNNLILCFVRFIGKLQKVKIGGYSDPQDNFRTGELYNLHDKLTKG